MIGKRAVVVGACVALVGCGSKAGEVLDTYQPAKLESETDAMAWAGTSAPMVHLLSTSFILMLGVTGSFGGEGRDPNCPKQTKDGNDTTIEGGCTDSKGVRWVGKVEDKRDAAGSRTGRTTYTGFGIESSQPCEGGQVASRSLFDGTVKVSGNDDHMKFYVDLIIEGTGAPAESQGCATSTFTMAMDYEGSVREKGGVQTWNGSGKVGNSVIGVVSAETEDEVINLAVCDKEASSGTTTVTAGSNTVVYTYDGASKCDDDSRVKWSLNGQDRGELAGVRCAAAAAPAVVAWGLLALLGTTLLRRRR
jgi:hypothetical protein